MQTVATDADIQLPPELAVCPICGEKVIIEEITGWVQEDDGSWRADEISINCETEPDTDSDDWEDWHNWHWNMPYVDWLPLSVKVEAWLAKHYRFEMADA